MEFNKFKLAVQKQFEKMAKNQLFRVNVNKDDLWTTYLNSFPAGTDPIYRERTEHDCSCCRQFIKNVGDVVAVIDGEVVSLWDVTIKNEPAYQAVADALSKFVKSAKIGNEFLHFERTAGTDKNFEQLTNGTRTWDHFFLNIPPLYYTNGKQIDSVLAESRSTYDVFARSVKELTVDAVDTVLDLIASNSLYRGEENKWAVSQFKQLKLEADRAKNLNAFLWSKVKTTSAAVTRIRNTSIGSLLVDLSEGVDLEQAVKSFESKVAPTNYKRPTALVTEKMVSDAKAKLQELGLVSALERRYAVLEDITVNNILFANRDAKKAITGDVFDEIASKSSKKLPKLDQIEEINIEKFISDILPRTNTIELLLENNHANNFVSLIAPVDPTAGNLFKWDNKFSWSYTGNVADSIKERVKKAGGKVDGVLCCRLAWDYTDDLDFYMKEPSGHKIYFGTRGYQSPCGGMLDVDANGCNGMMNEPVENIFYNSVEYMEEGIYKLSVNNYNARQREKFGFEVEIEFGGEKYNFVYEKRVGTGETIHVADIKYSKKDGFSIVKSLPSTKTTKQIWNLDTNNFHNVSVMMLSPNFWDEKAVGNKHYFFMLENCKNNDDARGFYNEYLREDLNPHRKVFEIVGSRMKAESVDNQLSGLGFSSTQQNSVVLRVSMSNTSRLFKVVF